MRTLIPFRGPGGLRSEIDRLFDRFFDDDGADVPPLGEWAPRVDVVENKDQLTITAEIPGIDAKDIEVSLQDRMLTIKGEKKQEKEEKGEHHYRMERSYGAFARAVRLPAPVDAGKVDATFKNGVLTVKMPKAAAAKGSAITVKAA